MRWISAFFPICLSVSHYLLSFSSPQALLVRLLPRVFPPPPQGHQTIYAGSCFPSPKPRQAKPCRAHRRRISYWPPSSSSRDTTHRLNARFAWRAFNKPRPETNNLRELLRCWRDYCPGRALRLFLSLAHIHQGGGDCGKGAGGGRRCGKKSSHFPFSRGRRKRNSPEVSQKQKSTWCFSTSREQKDLSKLVGV